MATEISASKEKRDLVDRVANSPTFQRSPRLREFLLYVAECTISDRLEEVREQQIAANVFNRKPDYNPGQDNIVRVEARSLRKRLETYFATEGKDEPLIISMPKGSYSLAFEPRPLSFAEPEPPPVEIAYPEPADAVAAPSGGHSRWLNGVLWVVIAMLAGVLGAQWQLRRSERAFPRSAPPLDLPFSALIEPNNNTYIVTSDSCLVLIEELKRKQINLDEYITGRYATDPAPDPVRQDLIRILLQRRYTNVPETGIAMRIIQRNSWNSQHLFLRSGHGIQLSDFKNHNAILFGSVTSNPWVALFNEKLNFKFEWDSSRRGMFRNQRRAPESRKFIP